VALGSVIRRREQSSIYRAQVEAKIEELDVIARDMLLAFMAFRMGTRYEGGAAWLRAVLKH